MWNEKERKKERGQTAHSAKSSTNCRFPTFRKDLRFMWGFSSILQMSENTIVFIRAEELLTSRSNVS